MTIRTRKALAGTRMAALILAALATATLPAAAGPGRGKDKGHHHAAPHHARHCPPGLARKNPPCVPPGQARHSPRPGIGDRLRPEDFVLIRDPRRHNLETRDGWRYYRDDRHTYRVDPETRRVLAVLELIDAFSN